MTQDKSSLVRRTFSTKRRIERKGTFRQSAKYDCEAACVSEESPVRGRWKRLRHSESFLKGKLSYLTTSKNVRNISPDAVALDVAADTTLHYDNTNNTNSERLIGRQNASSCYSTHILKDNSYLTPNGKRKSIVHFDIDCCNGYEVNRTLHFEDNNEFQKQNNLLANCSSTDKFFNKVWPMSAIKNRMKQCKSSENAATPKRSYSFSKRRTHHITPKSNKFTDFSQVPELLFTKSQSPPIEFLRYNSYRFTKSLASKQFVRNKVMGSIRRSKLLVSSPILTSAQVLFNGNLSPNAANNSNECGPVAEKIGNIVTDRCSIEQLANGWANSHKECPLGEGDFVGLCESESRVLADHERAARNKLEANARIIRDKQTLKSNVIDTTCTIEENIKATEMYINTIDEKLKCFLSKADIKDTSAKTNVDNSKETILNSRISQIDLLYQLVNPLVSAATEACNGFTRNAFDGELNQTSTSNSSIAIIRLYKDENFIKTERQLQCPPPPAAIVSIFIC